MALRAKFFLIIALIISKETVTTSEVETFDEKTFDLTRMLKNDYVLHISNIHIFKDYVKCPKKEYSFVVLFTVSQNCPMCEFTYQEFMVVAHSYKLSKEPNRLFFGIVDYSESTAIFRMMHLNAVPAIVIFPANEDIKPDIFIDMEMTGYHAENIAFLIEKKVHIKITLQRSFLVANIMNWVMFLIPIIYFIHQRDRNDLLEFLRSGQIWAMTAVVYCGLVTSGQIYNHIVRPPLIDMSGEETVDENMSFQIESYAAAFMTISISVGMIVLIEGRGGVKRDRLRRNDSACVVGLTTVVVCFSLYIYMLKRKLSGQYPYTLIF